jgi:hypothetical protein
VTRLTTAGAGNTLRGMQALAGGLVATVATCVALAPASLAAGQAPRTAAVQTTVTGEITKLGLAKIAIGHVGCAIPAKLAVSAGRFVVSDSVRITCLNGKLRSVKYSPELATAQTTRPGGGNAPTTVPAPTPTGGIPSGGNSIYVISVLYLGGPPPGQATTVTGTIDDIESSSITVAGMTCSFHPFPNSTIFAGPQVGDNVTLDCVGGQLTHLASVGAVSH